MAPMWRCLARGQSPAGVLAEAGESGIIANARLQRQKGGVNRNLFLVAALAALIPNRAQAQADTQTDAILAMHRYAECVVSLSAATSGILGVPPGSPAERALLRQIMTPRCFNGQGFVYVLDDQPQLLRGAIAEVVLRGGNRRDGRRVRWVPPFTIAAAADVEALDERGRSSLRALDFAQCIVAASPAAVETLLGTLPTMPPEDRAFRLLTPSLGPCLPAGARMSVSRPQLRGFLAEAAYRRAYSASQGSANPARH
jgi:hypothetical protein